MSNMAERIALGAGGFIVGVVAMFALRPGKVADKPVVIEPAATGSPASALVAKMPDAV